MNQKKRKEIEIDFQEEFKRLFQEYYRQLYFLAFNFLKESEAAENVVQDAFITLWEQHEKVDLSKSILPWLITITRNKSLNLLKREKIRRRYLDDSYQKALELKEFLVADGSDFILEQKELGEAIEKSLNGMSSKIRETFLLCKFDGKKYSEVAELENVSIKTIEYRIMVAFKILRQDLQKFFIPILVFLASQLFI